MRICSEELKARLQRHFPPMFTVAVFTTVKGSHTSVPARRVYKRLGICADQGVVLSLKYKSIMTHDAIWMHPDDLTLRETSQTYQTNTTRFHSYEEVRVKLRDRKYNSSCQGLGDGKGVAFV